MRKIIAFMQMSVDGFIEGSNGELPWVQEEDGRDVERDG
jgi:dihydrofolate reductase